MSIVLSVDPGLNNIGYNLYNKDEKIVIKHGEYKNSSNILELKLIEIFNLFKKIFEENNITELVYENPVFLSRGDIGQKIAFALGILLLIAGLNKCKIYSYSAKYIKKEVTGNGNADKKEVEQKVKEYFKIKTITSNHASDSLAVLITYIKNEL